MDKKELVKTIESLPSLTSITSIRPYVDKKIVLGLISQLDEPHKVVVPQFVADWYEENKDGFEGNLYRNTLNIPSTFDGAKLNEFERWFLNSGTKPFQTLVNMHQFGYEVEKKKRYLVKVKGMKRVNGCLAINKKLAIWFFGTSGNSNNYRTHHTRKELEEAGFGWVFDCPGIEVEEVEA
nr:MAG TPA: Protein of unknown function (DUF1642) [Caudoviricetes sp.]